MGHQWHSKFGITLGFSLRMTKIFLFRPIMASLSRSRVRPSHVAKSSPSREEKWVIRPADFRSDA